MALQIIYIIIGLLILPVLAGYLIEATQWVRMRMMSARFRWERRLRNINLLPKLIRNEIRIRKEIVAEEKYQAERLPELKETMRASFSGTNYSTIKQMDKDDGVWALAERLTHTEHTHKDFWGQMDKEENSMRPPMWVRYVIAQIIR